MMKNKRESSKPTQKGTMRLGEWFSFHFSPQKTSKKKPANTAYHDGVPDFANSVTCFTNVRYSLLYLDGSLVNYLKICIPIFFLATGTISFAMADIVHMNEKNTIWIVENGHWCIIYTAVLFWDAHMGWFSPIILEMNNSVKYGVYRYEKYEANNRMEFGKNNAWISKMNRVFGVIYIVAVIGTLVKSTILEEQYPFKHLFNGWFPFEINSFMRLNIVRIYELGCAWSAASGAQTFFMTTMAYTYHVEAHLRLLMQKVAKVLDSQHPEKQIQECLAHHRAILRLFNNLSAFFDPTVGFSTLTATFMVCTLLYLITNPDFDMNVIVTFSFLVAPELGLLVSVRIRGQKLTDLSSEVNKTIYDLNWLEQDIKLQKDLLMWLRLTSKPLELKAFGYRNVSHAGVKEVLQTSYTFFNMLKAST
uniref:Odorant receptor n=1 Tax=Adelphocoris lineolatus TaxID=236346 RepID=A0A2I4PH50_ADELI|nr:olfactory receptor 52 [Adelphocoris lineolatus]